MRRRRVMEAFVLRRQDFSRIIPRLEWIYYGEDIDKIISPFERVIIIIRLVEIYRFIFTKINSTRRIIHENCRMKYLFRLLFRSVYTSIHFNIHVENKSRVLYLIGGWQWYIIGLVKLESGGILLFFSFSEWNKTVSPCAGNLGWSVIKRSVIYPWEAFCLLQHASFSRLLCLRKQRKLLFLTIF